MKWRTKVTPQQHIQKFNRENLIDRQTHARRGSVTRHIHRTPRTYRAADAQLPVPVVAPALDPAPAHNRARVVPSQGDGNGGDACEENNNVVEIESVVYEERKQGAASKNRKIDHQDKIGGVRNRISVLNLRF